MARKKDLKLSLIQMGCMVQFGAIHFINMESGEVVTVALSSLRNGEFDAELLEDFHARRREFIVCCGCKSEAPAHLYFRRRRGRFEICLNPAHALNHAPECEFRRDPSRSVGTPGGPVKSLDIEMDPLFNPKRILVGAGSADGTGGTRKRRGTRTRPVGPVSLAAGVARILHEARLHIHKPGESSQDWGAVAVRMAQAVEVSARRLGLEDGAPGCLPRIVHDGSLVNLHLVERSDDAEGRGVRPTILVGAVSRLRRENGKVRVLLEGETTWISFASRTWNYAIKHSPSRNTSAVLKNLESGSLLGRVVGAFAVTRIGDRQLRGHGVGLCVTTHGGILVESGHELEAANILGSLFRWFIKDIYLPEGYLFRHDFRLLDTLREFILEVFGMDFPEYVATHEPVENHLREEHAGHHAIWRPEDHEPFPDLPPADRREEVSNED